MPIADDLVFWRELPGVGERTLCRLLELARRDGTTLRAVADFEPDALRHRYRLSARTVARLSHQRPQHLARCASIINQLRQAGALAVAIDSAAYPRRLLAIEHPPPLLFTLGNRRLLEHPSLAILSSREIADETLQATLAIVEAALREGLTIVTGGMKSTHRLAAMAARSMRGARIVVLDRGLLSAFAGDFRTDPFGCGPKRARFDRSQTVVLSPFRPEDHAAPSHGRRRDQLIAALGTLVFASSARCGGETERICMNRLAAGKPVLVWGRGNPDLLRAGAHPVDRHSLPLALEHFLGPAK